MSQDRIHTIDERNRPLTFRWLMPLGLLVVLAVALFLRVYRLASVPFGWHPDEAVYALYARDILAGRNFPIFFDSWTGREVMYSYLEAAAFGLLGDSMLTARLVSATIGMLTVALTYLLGKRLFGRRAGLFAAALIAVSLLHVIDSRNGYRAVIQPLIQVPALLFLFRGLSAPPESRSSRISFVPTRKTVPEPAEGRFSDRYFVLAGLFLGLTQYTYSASRFFPVLVLCIVALGWIFARPQLAPHARSLLLMFSLALIVFAPLGWHFLRNWDAVFGRASTLSVFAPQWSGGHPWQRLFESVRDTAGMFTVAGDPNFRFNLAGQPVFNPVVGALFYAGFLLCIWRAVRLRGLPRLVHLSLLAWLLIMLLPMTLSAEGIPYYLRAIGTLPAIYFFPALALDESLNWVQRLLRGRAHQASAVLSASVLVAAFGFLALQTYRDYFQEWHLNPRNDDDRAVTMVYVADYLRRSPWQGQLYISTEFVEDPTLSFLGGLTQQQYSSIHWFSGSQALPLPPKGVEATYVSLSGAPLASDLLAKAADLQLKDSVADRFGRPAFNVYVLPGSSWPEPAQRNAKWSWEVSFEDSAASEARHPIALPVDLGGVLSLAGYDGPAHPVAAGQSTSLVLYWLTKARSGQDLSVFAHLLDRQSRIVGEYDGAAYPARFWLPQGGELVLSLIPISVKPGTLPGEYQLEVGVYNRADGKRLPINEQGQMVADRLLLAPVQIR